MSAPTAPDFVFTPAWSAPSTPLRPTWAPLANIDQFRWLPRADVQAQLARARDELGVRHVRAAAMYSPEFCVWDHDLADWQKPAAEKTKRANWQAVDLAIEGLLALGLKPIYTTCFVPRDFTDRTAACWPDSNAVGLPRDLDQWAAFVASGIRHHIARYGIEEVRSWYFECWNEPNLRDCFFGGTREEFFQLWSATWRAVKSVDPLLRFGGPSTARAEWIPEFLDHAARDGTPPDYIVAHIYNNDSASQPLSPFDGPASHKVADSPHFASGVIRGLRAELVRRGFTGEVHWNEWGRSWFLCDPLRHTALEAAFIAKTMAEVSQHGDYFAFWCLSDIYNQGGFQSSEFQGNYGMLSLHGLAKPAYRAHQLLQRLGPARLPCVGGDELCAALPSRHPDGRTATLLYAYPADSATAATPVTLTVRLALPPGIARATLHRIGKVDNNLLSLWAELGSPPYPTPAQLVRLRAADRLTPSPASALHLDDGHATFTLEVPGVALLETTPA